MNNRVKAIFFDVDGTRYRQLRREKVYHILVFVPERQKKLLEDLLDECHVTSWNDTDVDIIP